MTADKEPVGFKGRVWREVMCHRLRVVQVIRLNQRWVDNNNGVEKDMT